MILCAFVERAVNVLGKTDQLKSYSVGCWDQVSGLGSMSGKVNWMILITIHFYNDELLGFVKCHRSNADLTQSLQL